jgi:type I restriction enzyme R subunit
VGPWGKAKAVPFLFATNGRPYLLQLKTKSGIWFRDARRAENKADALPGWYTPEGLLDTLGKKDIDAAHAALKAEPTGYLSFLRDYQLQAIEAVEAPSPSGQRRVWRHGDGHRQDEDGHVPGVPPAEDQALSPRAVPGRPLGAG